MRVFFSDIFNVSPSLLEEYGAFDISLLNDLPLFIDPFLLFNSDNDEYQKLHNEIIKYMLFLKERTLEEKLSEPLIQGWFTFPEVKQNWLGFSLKGNKGHGLGRGFAKSLNRGFSDVFRDFGRESITHGSHLEKLCLIRDGVGRDNISDFTANLIKGFLAEYTSAFAVKHLTKNQIKKIPVNRSEFNYDTRTWKKKTYDLPVYQGEYVLLTPKDILTKDEAWINRPEMLESFRDITAALPNDVLRAQVNDYLRRMLPKGPKVSRERKFEVYSDAIENFPQILDYFIRKKEDSGERATSIANARVQEVQQRFNLNVRHFITDHLEPGEFYRMPDSTYDEAKAKILFLKDVIENKGGHKLFYSDGKSIERESDLHILYRLTWFGSQSNISREVNDGRGPVDFMVSRGSSDKTLVEFKLAKNTKLEQNLRNQVGVYEKASDPTKPSLKVILYFNDEQFERVHRILKNLDLLKSPHIILIDASSNNKPSGSNA